ncbi:hypothetical protein [Streptomyces chilikensis]|uniref:hypothetical protein n=1 Tax=Streptomyces chilikensis TaxID=1194079 RepID=UPI0014099315|nr:hypothetical protein [Streptomyces chilikensis]
MDPFLKSAVRQEVSDLYELGRSADGDLQIGENALAMSKVAVAYGELRLSLLRDSGQENSEPPWRTFGNGRLALRMRRRLGLSEALVLTPDRVEGSSREWPWTFTVLSRPRDPNGPSTRFGVTLHRRRDAESPRHRVDAQKELLADEELTQQLLYGLVALGLELDSTVGRECPGVGQVGKTIFLEPSDEWRVKCHVCGMQWAGGSDVLSEHQDLRYGFW